MAFYQFVCSAAVMIILSFSGSHSAPLDCSILIRWHAPPDYWPWHVFITTEEGHQCSGSLISKEWVLTDVDCGSKPSDPMKVFLGLTNISDPSRNYKESRIVTHIECNNRSACLLKLSGPVNFTDSIYPVHLAAAGSAFHSGLESWVMSGSPSGTSEEVQIVGHSECKCVNPGLAENMICAGPHEHIMGQDGQLHQCLDYPGGAMVTLVNVTWIQIGIVHPGQLCPRHKNLNFYFQVSALQDFISLGTGNTELGFVHVHPRGVDADTPFTCPTTELQRTTLRSTTNFIRLPTSHCTQKFSPGDDCKDDDGETFDTGVDLTPSCLFISLCVLAPYLASLN